MSKRAIFTEADVRRAIRAALKAGLQLGQVEVSVTADGARVTTFAVVRQAPGREEPNSWDDRETWRETFPNRKAADAAAADRMTSAICGRTTVADISAAFSGKRSLGETEAAKLLGVAIQDLDVLKWGERLRAVRRRYPEAAILALLGAS